MKIGDLFYETWHALSANKGRSFLTILGIVIGIAAVIAMTSLIAGVQNMLMGEMGLSQARQVSISAYSPQGITFDDLDKLEQGMPEYEVITGASYASPTARKTTPRSSARVPITSQRTGRSLRRAASSPRARSRTPRASW